MDILAISDQHGNLPEIPPCDILLIAGDVCPMHDHSLNFQLSWLETNFKEWLNKIPAKRVVMTFGNHDNVSQQKKEAVQRIGLRADLLFDETVVVDGIKIWGSPWSNWFYDWAWNAYEPQLKEIYSKIPDDVDIIITHGPPRGYCDTTLYADRIGSISLLERLEEMSKKVLVCGHNHEEFGKAITPKGNTVYNVALVDSRTRAIVNTPTRIEL